MADVLVEAAIKGLEALGFPITPSTPYILDLLIQEGEDALTAFPTIVHTIEQLGGNTWQVLEEVASGFYQYGPTTYVQRTVENHFEPQVSKVKDIQLHKAILTEHHRAALQKIHATIASLHTTGSSIPTGGLAFTGNAANAMIERLTEISTHFEKLMTTMDDSQQIDRDLQTDLQHVFELIVGMVILDLIIFVVVFIIVFVGSQLILLIPEVALAPESGGLSLAAGGGASLGGAAAIAGGAVTALLPAEGAIILGMLVYAFGRWAVRHAMLEIAQPATSYSYPIISSKPTLPNPKLTPEEAKLANDLFKEFGGAVPEKTLQYLVQMLGVSQLSAAMIRCLYQSGYLDLSSYMGGKGKPLTDANKNAWININDHFTPNDLEGAWKDANPGEVDPSTITDPNHVSGADHHGEVEASLNAIENLIRHLRNVITILNNKISHAPDPNGSGVLDMINKRERLQKLEDAYIKLRDFVKSKIVKGSPSPDTWPDQGKLPIVEDLLQTSSCKIPAAQYYK